MSTPVFDDEVLELAARVIDSAREHGKMLGCVESCTGGLIGAALTSIPGSSDVFAGGLTTYSNEAKVRLVGVDRGQLEEHGAVSSPVAAHMAMGGMAVLGVDRCVSVTGIAGPGGGTEDKPVGTVWFGVAIKGEAQVKCALGEFGRDGEDRDGIRREALLMALRFLEVVEGRD
ncbi:MAG: CinA family protein [Phycisphaerales bacterium]|nr:CinA family protein [Phycisphaerales bacterium]